MHRIAWGSWGFAWMARWYRVGAGVVSCRTQDAVAVSVCARLGR